MTTVTITKLLIVFLLAILVFPLVYRLVNMIDTKFKLAKMIAEEPMMQYAEAYTRTMPCLYRFIKIAAYEPVFSYWVNQYDEKDEEKNKPLINAIKSYNSKDPYNKPIRIDFIIFGKVYGQTVGRWILESTFCIDDSKEIGTVGNTYYTINIYDVTIDNQLIFKLDSRDEENPFTYFSKIEGCEKEVIYSLRDLGNRINQFDLNKLEKIKKSKTFSWYLYSKDEPDHYTLNEARKVAAEFKEKERRM